MSFDDFAVCVNGMSKCYQVYRSPGDRLRQFLFAPFFRAFEISFKPYFKEFWALRDISFSIKRGETVGIIGRNGSGKSTLLQIICGTLNPTAGTIATYGRVAALLELGAGFNPEFTGRENIYLNAALLGLTRHQIDERIEAIIDFADIGEFVEQPVKTYSSGMYVRLAFAVIAHVDADILVVDEALAVGDVFFTQKCMRFLRQFQEHGTVVFVTHDTGALLGLCERAVWLEAGQIKCVGDAKTVCELYLSRQYNSINSALNSDQTESPSNRKNSSDSNLINKTISSIDRSSSFIRNKNDKDIEVFQFQTASRGFGTGGAQISSVQLCDKENSSLHWIAGGEFVTLLIHVTMNVDAESLIVGFFVKDRLGQILFGENTNLVYEMNPVSVQSGDSVTGHFSFYMPYLQKGNYTVDVAVANGDHINHEQLQWMHDAISFESHRSSVSAGLVGIPFESIKIINTKLTS